MLVDEQRVVVVAGSVEAVLGEVDQATQAQQSYSGVNLDQEAANLIQYQQAYQASAQVIATSQTIFSSLLTAVQR